MPTERSVAKKLQICLTLCVLGAICVIFDHFRPRKHPRCGPFYSCTATTSHLSKAGWSAGRLCVARWRRGRKTVGTAKKPQTKKPLPHRVVAAWVWFGDTWRCRQSDPVFFQKKPLHGAAVLSAGLRCLQPSSGALNACGVAIYGQSSNCVAIPGAASKRIVN